MNARKPLESRYRENTEIKDYLSNEEYDSLLTQNIGFLDLYDASANNAVVECLARATPLLINPIPPVVEYLGKDYPFYFETLAQAAGKALDFDLVRQAHEYLLNCPTRSRLSGDCFLEAVVNSEVYQQLTEPQPRNMAG